jgi:hypothetical protein
MFKAMRPVGNASRQSNHWRRRETSAIDVLLAKQGADALGGASGPWCVAIPVAFASTATLSETAN